MEGSRELRDACPDRATIEPLEAPGHWQLQFGRSKVSCHVHACEIPLGADQAKTACQWAGASFRNGLRSLGCRWTTPPIGLRTGHATGNCGTLPGRE